VNVRHTVKLQNVIIGWSDLEQRDPSLHRAWGQFRPGTGYELVQPVFRLFTEAVPLPGGEPMDEEKLERYHAARDKLGLVLEDAAGRPIATSAIHIADYTGRGGTEALELDVLVRDERFWKAEG
jgi:hypothetical protein